MRIRQIKPGFWSDKVMAHLPKCTRLTYIGLWMLADDAGWIEAFDVEQAGAELFPFDSVARRERDLGADVERLVEAGRVVKYDCGCLQVPHLEEHQRIAGNRVFTARDHHRRHATGSEPPLDIATSSYKGLPVATVGNGRVGKGRERKGTVISAQAREESDFRSQVAPPPGYRPTEFEDFDAPGTKP